MAVFFIYLFFYIYYLFVKSSAGKYQGHTVYSPTIGVSCVTQNFFDKWSTIMSYDYKELLINHDLSLSRYFKEDNLGFTITGLKISNKSFLYHC